MNRSIPTTLLLALLVLPTPGASEEPDPAFMLHLYPPDLVMRFQREIQLKPDQRRAITKTVRATQDEVLDIQWKIQDAVQTLAEAAENGDEETLVAAAEPVFRLESRIKLSHLRLMARIKQILTPTQRARLDGLRPRPAGAAPAE